MNIKTHKYNEKRFFSLGFISFAYCGEGSRSMVHVTGNLKTKVSVELALEEYRREISQKGAGYERRNSLPKKEPLKRREAH